MRARGETEQARAIFRDALAIAEEVHGEAHPVTLGIRRLLVAILVDQELYRQAEAQIGPLYATTLKALGPHHRDTGLASNTRGIIAFQRGHMQAAIEDLAQAVRIWRDAGSQQLQGGLFNYGMVLHAAGREEEALAALLESRELRVRQYGASDDSVGEADRLIGEVLASQGKGEMATPYLDRA